MMRPLLGSLAGAPTRTFAGTRPEAAVLLFHGLRSDGASLDDVGRQLAERGRTAILVDAPQHGARRSDVLETMPDTGTREGYARLLRILQEARDELPLLVDEVLALGHDRVAIAGVSMGAYVALSAAAVEPRLSAIASVLGSPDWTPHEGEAASAAAQAELAPAIAESPCRRPSAFVPRPLLLLNGAHDAAVRPEPARALAAVLRPEYDAVGRGDALVHVEYDVPHYVPPPVWSEMMATMTAFLERWVLRS